jgi:hypothetical protein
MANTRVPELTAAPPHKWQFAPRFRRQAFGWRSDTPIQRIKEAVSEIKLVARKDMALAAAGAGLRCAATRLCRGLRPGRAAMDIDGLRV